MQPTHLLEGVFSQKGTIDCQMTLASVLATIDKLSVPEKEKADLRSKAIVSASAGIASEKSSLESVAIKNEKTAADEKMTRDKTSHIGTEAKPAVSAEILELLRNPSGQPTRWLANKLLKLLDDRTSKKIIGWFLAAGAEKTPKELEGVNEPAVVLRMITHSLLERVYFARAVAVAAKSRPANFKAPYCFDTAFDDLMPKEAITTVDRVEGDLYADALHRVNKSKHVDLFDQKNDKKRERDDDKPPPKFRKNTTNKEGNKNPRYSFEECKQFGLCSKCFGRGHIAKDCTVKE